MTKKGAGAAATWTPSFLLLPALSRAEPEFLIIKGRQSPKAAIPIGQRGEGPANHRGRKSVFPSDNTHRRPSSAFFVFDEKQISISESVFLPPPPLLRRAFPLMVGGSIPLSELGGHSFQPYSNRGGGAFEYRLKHDLKVLATPCVQYKIWKAARMTKRGRFPVLH